jgi:hypothetical protein
VNTPARGYPLREAVGFGDRIFDDPALVGVIRQMLLPDYNSVNQRLPSGPAVIAQGDLYTVGTENSVTAPSGVICPMWLETPSGRVGSGVAAPSANQRFPSGPAVIEAGWLLV